MSDRYHIPSEIHLGSLLLHGSEAHHLANVCRLRVGAEVRLFNGDGNEYNAVVVKVSKREVELDVIGHSSPQRESARRLHVAVTLPKGDRGQFMVEKLTELGVTELTLISTTRSVTEASDAKREKIERWIIEASKQCGRNVLMKINPSRTVEDLLRDGSLPNLRIVAHPGGETLGSSGDTALIVTIGPEGGFTDEEVQIAQEHGWRLVGFGARILRVETAAIMLAAKLCDS
jgi:16S rRNA (uracil1498-N3)-methyltransferase